MRDKALSLLGKKVTDSICKITGTVTCVNFFYNGCIRVCIEYTRKGEPLELWVDIQRVLKEKKVSEKLPGGSGSIPPAFKTK